MVGGNRMGTGRRRTGIVYFWCWYLVACSAVCRAEEKETQEAFAEYLVTQGNFSAAYAEYERLFFNDSIRGSPAFDSYMSTAKWRYRQGLCLKSSGNHAAALRLLQTVPKQSPFFDSATIESAICCIKSGLYQRASSLLVADTLSATALLVKGYAQLCLNNYTAAQRCFNSVSGGAIAVSSARSLSMLTDTIRLFKPKKYPYAAVLALVPGLGHCYTKRYGDGIQSSITVASFAAVAAYYSHYHADKNAAVMGTIASLFYAGSIYGALVSVKIYNREQAKGLRLKAWRLVEGL
ncbi:MAG: hypothetical protein JW795_22800 [Chitinivibrionales bacterium]|nr:hypothetical protein [Chitinivibrionales bacterium]